jgi:hypothetical protein
MVNVDINSASSAISALPFGVQDGGRRTKYPK